MSEQLPQEFKALSREELNQLAGEELPERAAMSLINANVAAPINAAVAANVFVGTITSSPGFTPGAFGRVAINASLLSAGPRRGSPAEAA